MTAAQRSSGLQWFPHKLLVFGITLVLVGVVLLLRTAGLVPEAGVVWVVVPLVVGVLLLYLAFAHNGPEGYVFVGMILTLVGVVLLLLNTVMSSVELFRIWPLFMTITGASLAVYANTKVQPARITLQIPSVAIILLSGVFLLFSLEVVERDFRRVVAMWWPTILIVFGAVLLWVYFRRSKSHAAGRDNSAHHPPSNSVR